MLERKVSDLYSRLGQAEPAFDEAARFEPDEETIRLLQEGNEIQAIKHHREVTGMGLAEAKDDIDRLRGTYRPLG